MTSVYKYDQRLMKRVPREIGRQFDGVANGLSHSAITFGTNDFFIDMFLWVDTLPAASSAFYWGRDTNQTGINILMGGTTPNEELRVQVYETTTAVGNHPTFSGRTLQTGMWTYIHLAFDRSGNLSFYIDNPTTVHTVRDITAWAALNLVQGADPCYIGRTPTAYRHCRIAMFGIGVGALLDNDDRTELRNGGRGLHTAALSTELAAKFTHRWDLIGGNLRDEIGDKHLTAATMPRRCSRPQRKQKVYASSYGFATADSTTGLKQALLSEAREVVIDKQDTPWIVTPITLRSDQIVTLEADTIVQAKTGEFLGASDCLLTASAVSNSILRGGSGSTVKMLKAEYAADSEFRMCLKMLGCSNVTVDGISFEDAGGDGIYIGGDLNENITIRNVNCENNNRNNISVINVDGLLIEDTTLVGATGTSPEAGIDFEPNGATDKLSNIILRRVTTQANNKCGFYLPLFNLTSATTPISILIEDCVSSGDSVVGDNTGRGGLWIEVHNDDTPTGSILVSNMTIEDSVRQGVTLRSKVVAGPTVELRDVTIDNPAAAVETVFPIQLSAASDDTVDNGGYTLTNVHVIDTIDRAPVGAYDDTDPAGPSGAITWSDISGMITVTYDGTTTQYVVDDTQMALWVDAYEAPAPP